MTEESSLQFGSTLPPEAISDELRPTIEELGLERNCRELAESGWTLVENIGSTEMNARLRQAVLDSPLEGGASGMLLPTDPIFAEAALQPKLLALAEFSVGAGFLLSSIFGSVKRVGEPGLELHVDMSQLPEPFPVHNQGLTACWATDGYGEGAGGTLVVPGSHLHLRSPDAQESAAAEGMIAVECPPNTAVLWDGRVWHAGGVRTLPGERVVAHISYCRLALRPTEDYSPWADELVAKHGPVMSQLLGREDYLYKSTRVDPERAYATFAKVRR